MKGIGNGRVIESTADDRVFVYFTDHGSPGLVAFPDDIVSFLSFRRKSVLFSSQSSPSSTHWNGCMTTNAMVNSSSIWSHARVDPCSTGCSEMTLTVLLAPTLDKIELSVYAITAANGRESSWGTYCDNDQNLPCLGDLFSVNWMNDSDKVYNLKS